MAWSDRAYEMFEKMRRKIFRVETNWARTVRSEFAPERVERDRHVSTAFGVGYAVRSERIVAATAKHVLDNLPDDADVQWSIQEVNEDGGVNREISFETKGSKEDVSKDVEFRSNKVADVAILIPPSIGKDGKPFLRGDADLVTMIRKHRMATTGTRVGWAGFPSKIEWFLNDSQLCYFEGVICASVNRPDQHYYLVDGHGMKGASGSPVWRYSNELGGPEVIGIVAEYKGAEDYFPGFCVVEPINHVIEYLHFWVREANNGLQATGVPAARKS